MSESFGIIMPRPTIITDYGWSGPAPSGFDPATNAWVSAVVAAGGTVSNTQKGRVDTLILGLKADSLFTAIDRLWLYAGESVAQQTTIDIINLGVATLHGTPSLAAAGYTGDATAFYIDSGVVPNAGGGQKYVRDSATLGVYVQTSSASSSGVQIGTNDLFAETLICQSGGSLFGAAINGGTINIAESNSRGLWFGTRTGASAIAAYLNGSSIGTNTSASTGLDDGNILIFCRNNAAGAGSPVLFTNYQMSSAIICRGLNATEAGNLSTRLNAYMTAWGVNVY